MDLLILYSESRRSEFVSLAALLKQQGFSFHPHSLSDPWNFRSAEDFLGSLKSTSHWLFLADADDFNAPAFLFASGYAIAARERCYLLETSLPGLPSFWKTDMQVLQDSEGLVGLLVQDSRRWQKFLQQQQAKQKIAETGLEVSRQSFIESIGNGDSAACELFLKAGFSPDLVDKKGVTALGLAVRASHLGIVRLLMEHGADIDLTSRDRNNSPLMDASAEGLFDIVQELVQHGAALTGESRNGQNALVLAIGKGAEDIAVLLLEAGADPYVADKLGMNACQYAQLLGRKTFLAAVSSRFPDRA